MDADAERNAHQREAKAGEGEGDLPVQFHADRLGQILLLPGGEAELRAQFVRRGAPGGRGAGPLLQIGQFLAQLPEGQVADPWLVIFVGDAGHVKIEGQFRRGADGHPRACGHTSGIGQVQDVLFAGHIHLEPAARRQDGGGAAVGGVFWQGENGDVLQPAAAVFFRIENIPWKIADVAAFRQLGVEQFAFDLEEQVDIGHAALRAELHVDPGAERAAQQAEQQHRRDQGQQADAAGAGRRQFVIRAEPAEDQQHGCEQTHRQGKYPDERDEQADGLSQGARAGVAADQQGEDFPQHIAEQQHEGEHRHRQAQRGENLTKQICVQRFQGAISPAYRSKPVSPPRPAGANASGRTLGDPVSGGVYGKFMRALNPEFRALQLPCSFYRGLERGES